MSIRTVYECDVCGILRQPSNHWLLYETTDIDGNPAFETRPWDDKAADESNHLCGAACAAKKLNQTMEGWRNESRIDTHT